MTNFKKCKHWAVTVSMNGEELVTIETNSLSGKPDFTDEEAQVIRDAARHLEAFMGDQWTAEDDEYFRSGTRYPGQ